MCDFFSFCENDCGEYFFFNAKMREELKSSNPSALDPDSHTSIAKFFGLQEDRLNKYEYNPLTKKFITDGINTRHANPAAAVAWARSIDFKTIVPELVIKPIVNPFDLPKKRMKKEYIRYLKQWDSVTDSVKNSVWDSVKNSVWDSVWDSVGNSVWDSVWDSVVNSVWDSVGNSVWDSVWDSVMNSVWYSVWVYIGSFFNIKFKYDLSYIVKLWEVGIVPSFDGTVWRLHSGEQGTVIYQITQNELREMKL